MEMSPRNLVYLTETQIRYLSQKPLNILTKKINAYEDDQRVLNSAMKIRLFLETMLWFVLAIHCIVQ